MEDAAMPMQDTPSLGGGGKPGKMQTRRMDIRHTENGGFIARHEMADKKGNGGAAKEYGLTDGPALLKHVQEHMIDNAPQAVAGSE